MVSYGKSVSRNRSHLCPGKKSAASAVYLVSCPNISSRQASVYSGGCNLGERYVDECRGYDHSLQSGRYK